MNINRGVVLLIWNTHSHLCSALVEKRSSWRRRRTRLWSPCWFYLLSFWGIYIEEAFAGFFHLGFSQYKSLCSFFLWLCLSIFQWSCLYAFIMKMKWNTDVLAKHMKNSTWYQIHPERRNCATTESRASQFLVLSPQSISKIRLGWLSIEGCIFLSKRNSIPSIFSFWCGKLGILAEEEFLSEPSIGFLSS